MPFFGVPIRNGLPIGLGSVAGFGVQQFDPLELFASGAEGVWYDPSDTSTLFQDPAGTTPVTAVEQPVGLMLDKSKGLVLGSELAPAISALTATLENAGSAVSTFSAGVWSITGASSLNGYPRLRIDIPGIVIGRRYLVTLSLSWSGGIITGVYARMATNGSANDIGTLSVSGSTITARQIAAATNVIELVSAPIAATNTGTITINNISVRELPGNHAISYNATTARPTLSARVNLLTYSEEFDNGVWNKGTSTVVTPNAGIAPNGTTTAERLQMPIGGGTFLNQQVSVTNGVTYTFSFFANALEASVINIGFAVGFSSSISISDSGPITIAAGWAQYSFQVVSNTTGSLWISIDNNLNTTSCDMLIWGADLRVSNIGSAVPAYQRIAAATDYDTNGFPKYLYFAGVDDGMSTPANLNLTSTDKVTVFSGVRKLSDAAAAILTELSANFNTNSGTFFVTAPDATGASGDYGAVSRGSAVANLNQQATSAITLAPVTNVLTTTHDIPGDLSAIRLNGAASGTNGTGDKGSGNFGTYPLYIGSRANSSAWFNGYLYGLTVVGAQLTAPQIESMENWTGGKTGISVFNQGPSISLDFTDQSYQVWEI